MTKPRYTKKEIAEAIEKLEDLANNDNQLDTRFDGLAWDTYLAVPRPDYDPDTSDADRASEEYAEAAALLHDGWLPGDPLFALKQDDQPEIHYPGGPDSALDTPEDDGSVEDVEDSEPDGLVDAGSSDDWYDDDDDTDPDYDADPDYDD